MASFPIEIEENSLSPKTKNPPNPVKEGGGFISLTCTITGFDRVLPDSCAHNRFGSKGPRVSLVSRTVQCKGKGHPFSFHEFQSLNDDPDEAERSSEWRQVLRCQYTRSMTRARRSHNVWLLTREVRPPAVRWDTQIDTTLIHFQPTFLLVWFFFQRKDSFVSSVQVVVW